MNITLDRMSGQSFERLVRALAFQVFGADTCVFSAGPDGGRDATIEGKIEAYKSREWDGYLVLQSKYREKGDGGDVNDVQWLKSQVQKEKKAYLDPHSGRRVPDYFILITNVPLSGSDGRSSIAGKARKGGYSSIKDELKSWILDVGIKDFDIWPSDKVVDLLSGQIDIRRSFSAWLTPSDILDQVMEWMNGVKPDFATNIRRSLANSLRRKEYAELKDAGSVTDQRIRTGQIFVDVPFEKIGKLSLSETRSGNIVAELVRRSKGKFDVDSVLHQTGGRSAINNKIVLLGGPGQGKSTISTYLAQIFRSIILSNDPIAMRDEITRYVAPEILRRANAEGISEEAPMRYPVYVSLPLYADQISLAHENNAKTPSLLQYIASDVSETCDTEIERGDMRTWLKEFPWIVILDGLDEVPPSGERIGVIDGINSLVGEVNQLGADVLFLLTTRPQGYNDDLSPEIWEHWELSELPVERALRYTTALGLAKYPDEPARRHVIDQNLINASAAPATSRLLVTPLQATILFLIVDTGGSAPTARWSLFNEYFEVLGREPINGIPKVA